jgi:hypothetical protein
LYGSTDWAPPQETKGLSLEEVALVYDFGVHEGRIRAQQAMNERVENCQVDKAVGTPEAGEEEVKAAAVHVEVA